MQITERRGGMGGSGRPLIAPSPAASYCGRRRTGRPTSTAERDEEPKVFDSCGADRQSAYSRCAFVIRTALGNNDART